MLNTEPRHIALGTAALAIAAACLSPVAHADIRVPLAPGDSSSSDSSSSDSSKKDDSGVGSSAGKARNNRGAVARGNTGSDTSAGSDNSAPGAPTADAPESGAASDDAPPNRASTDISSAATGSNPLLQNPLWWFGTPNPNPPPGVQIMQTTPLADLPGWARPAFGWFTENIAENCVLGISNTVVGPYGTSTSRLSAGC